MSHQQHALNRPPLFLLKPRCETLCTDMYLYPLITLPHIGTQCAFNNAPLNFTALFSHRLVLPVEVGEAKLGGY